MTPARVLLACLLATPVAVLAVDAAACWWYETRFLPLVAGED